LKKNIKITNVKKKPWKKLIIISVVVVLFTDKCITANVPDEASIVYKNDPIITYQYRYTQRDLIPEQALRVSFNRNAYWQYFGYSSDLSVWGRLCITKPYKQLYIKEISYVYGRKKTNLLSDEVFSIRNIEAGDMLEDKNGEPVTINGSNYYWISVDFNKKIKRFFVFGFMGQEKEIELIQMYSFDDEEMREERVIYKVICGGKKFYPKLVASLLFPP
jgi:hypothetical protein